MRNLFMDLGQGAQGRVRPIDFRPDCIVVSLINSDYLYEESKSNALLPILQYLLRSVINRFYFLD